MRLEHGYSPHGTARERFLRSPAGKRRGGAGPLFPFPDEVRSDAVGFDLGGESLYLAWELASYAEGVDAVGHRVVHGGEQLVHPTLIEGLSRCRSAVAVIS